MHMFSNFRPKQKKEDGAMTARFKVEGTYHFASIALHQVMHIISDVDGNEQPAE